MSRWVRGAANAWQNQLNWQAKHKLDAEAGSRSLFGLDTLVPNIRHGWNHLMFIPAVAKGFIFGEELQDIPTVNVPEGLTQTEWGQDVQRHLSVSRETNELRVKAIEDQIMGALTLNLGRFNEGRAAKIAIDHAIAKQEQVILPQRTANAERQEQQAGVNIELPNVPREVAEIAQGR
jgi:hypothetical protein